ncbi:MULTISPECIES: acyl-CoA dehydrogenase family protein [Actinomycetes]|uniref:Hydrolase n=1 Tax=Streptomyces tendae TaxID=1932 RepID=A0A6B3QU40_STRTE|nr:MULTISPECIES: hydrolase [Streptomyces]BET45126.1 actinorhodin polyketide dimerase ActVA [Kitasatospora aureofaciens]MBQ0969411.1 hydrolase [Streptomyces sp. RK74B]MBQ1009055.1 hydrolase [Streptomyces sp. RK23]MZG15395.1 hydrolase [Streptomyces sp. SID5914]NEV89955.1 hydrolase [Streptomyces tendae]
MDGHTSARTTAEPALAVDKLCNLAAQHAETADRVGRLSPEVTGSLRETGFARHFVGARWGGTEGSFADLTEAVVALGRECAATSWCASLSAYSARFACHLPHEGQRALWSGGPDTMIATALMPGGRADAVDGGWRLTGRWSYVSGVDFADWVLLCAAVGSGDGPSRLRFFALPRGECTVHQDWDSVGMRATASHTVVVDSATVPDHLTFDRDAMVTGLNAHSDASAHNVPFQAVGGLTFIAPVIGAGTGALRAFAAGLTGRRRTAANESALVRASGRVDAARHLVEENTRVLDGRLFTPDHMARNERNATFAAEAVREAVGLLVAAAGTTGLGSRHPLQRLWRDITSATSHVALQYDTAARKNYAAVLAGPAE